MDDFLVLPFISFLHNFSGEGIEFLTFIGCTLFLLGLFRGFGRDGLYVYSVIATILSNIQVLKVAHFSFSPDPIALGTVTFSSIFLVSDIITEHYGKEAAKRSVWLCFFAQLSMVLMILSLGHAPAPNDAAHQAMEVLFLPAPRLVIASLIAFVLSLFLEISVFQYVRLRTKSKHLWLRTSLSTALSTLVDTIVFSTLAWVLLSSTPVSFRTLFFTYILGSYIIRLVAVLISTPIIYLSYWIKSENKPAII